MRITIVATAVVTAVLVATAIILLASQRRILTDNLDELLDSTSRAVEQSARDGALTDPISGRGDEDTIVQVVDADGTVIASTANFAGQAPLPAPAGGSSYRTVDVPVDEGRYRMLSRAADDVVVVHTAVPYDDVDESVAALRTGLVVAIPIVALVLAALTWWLVGRTLRPVEAIRSRVAAIGGERLDERVPEPATGDEIARLARTMNGMLERVEEAVGRQQRFVADASHELRSPLARIRTELEVDLRHPGTANPLATHRSTLEEVDALQRLVDDLLLLARADRGELPVRSAAVDLADIAIEEAERVRGASSLRVDTTGVTAAGVSGDRAQLVRVVRNLAENAARHATNAVWFTTTAANGTATLAVTDDGSGIAVGDRERVFERFTRLDDARTAGVAGAGLGLSIAREIVHRHGGAITVDAAHTDGARFVVTLPAG